MRFTIKMKNEIIMENNRLDPTAFEEEDLNWEKRLERLRQVRQFNTVPTHAPLVKKSDEAVDAASKTAPKKEYKLDAGNREKVLEEYLYRWQLEHNTALADDGEAVETDAMVVLQDNWLSAQSALQAAASERHIESTRTVRLNPKSGAIDFDTPEVEEIEKPENDGAEAAEEAVSDGLEQEPAINVHINVLNPQAIGRREVFCVSEKDLTERLIKRLRPHVADAVNGMIRIAVQKQMALFTYQLQQMLNEQAPGLVEDVLEHNVKRILDDMKTEMKYRR